MSFPIVNQISSTGLWPSFSADGKQIVYTEQDSLYVIPSSGGTPKLIVSGNSGISASRPDWSWSPDTIVFSVTQSSGTTLFLVNSDGTDMRPLPYTGNLKNTFYPSWYQDLNSVVAMDGGDNEHVILYQFDLQTGKATPLTTYSQVTAGRPSVGPNGERIAFAGTVGPFNQENNQIWIVNPPSTLATQLDPEQGRSPNFSPDGKWILFESNRNGGNYQLFVIPASGGTPVALTDGSTNATHGEWSRQQDRIVFQVNSNGLATFLVPQSYR